MKELTLNQKELARLQVLNNVLEHRLPMDQAAELLGVTERHAWRILAAYRREGAAALAHGSRGRRPPNAVPDELAEAVVNLARTHYPGANHTHLTDLLREREGIDLGRQTVRHILIKAGLPSPRRRRPPKHRVRRERMPRAGMLAQVDGNHHPWLEERGPRFVLLLAVDDATGVVANAVLRQADDTWDYFMLMDGLVRRWGIPLALYTDRHGVFKFSGRPRHVPRPVESTHFTRAVGGLGVQQIFARSPQAKGRVERAAGTFQDRLVTELRMVKATTIQQANQILERFIPRFNARFGVPAEQPDSAYRPVDPDISLAEVLCFKHSRKVSKDNTVKYNWRTLQLLPGEERPSYAGAKVEVLELPGGSLRLRHEGRTIPFREAPKSPGALRGTSGTMAPTPEIGQVVSRLVQHGLIQPQLRKLSSLEPPCRRRWPEPRWRPRNFGASQGAGADSATGGSLEGGAPRQAAGPVPARDRAGTGNSPQHRTPLCQGFDSASQSPSRRAWGITTGISHPIRRLTFPLDN